MEIETLLIVIVISYLVGSISFTRLVSHWLDPGLDIENVEIAAEGSETGTTLRNIGATTASVKLGPKVGCTIAFLDILKVAIPTYVFKLLYPQGEYFLIAAVFGMIGHNWPVFYRFRGGGGMSSIYGGFLAIDWIGVIPCSFAGMAIGFLLVKDVLVAYLAGVWLMIPWMWFRFHEPAYVLYAVVVNIIFMLALLPEIRNQIQAHKEGREDMTASMETFPMGRGMLKMMEKLKLVKKP